MKSINRLAQEYVGLGPSAAREVTLEENIAYTAILEGPDEGRETFGWYLCIAKRGEAGYHQLKPGYGPYENEADARAHAQELNVRMGLDPAEAIMIVLSSISAQEREPRRACKRRGRR